MRKSVIAAVAGAALVAGVGSGVAVAETGNSTADGYAACIAAGNKLRNNQLFPTSRLHASDCKGNETYYSWPSVSGVAKALAAQEADIVATMNAGLDTKQDKINPAHVGARTDGNATDAGEVNLSNVGGPITAGLTTLTDWVTLQPGKYFVSASGIFQRNTPAAAATPDTYGTLVIWADNDGNGSYDWQNGENAGTAQTGAIAKTPTGSIEATANVNRVLTITTPTKVALGGFGYNSDTGNYGTGTATFGVFPSLDILPLS